MYSISALTDRSGVCSQMSETSVGCMQEWLDQYGPFDAIVDGANIGLYNQNFGDGGFNFFQVCAMYYLEGDSSYI